MKPTLARNPQHANIWEWASADGWIICPRPSLAHLIPGWEKSGLLEGKLLRTICASISHPGVQVHPTAKISHVSPWWMATKSSELCTYIIKKRLMTPDGSLVFMPSLLFELISPLLPLTLSTHLHFSPSLSELPHWAPCIYRTNSHMQINPVTYEIERACTHTPIHTQTHTETEASPIYSSTISTKVQSNKDLGWRE